MSWRESLKRGEGVFVLLLFLELLHRTLRSATRTPSYQLLVECLSDTREKETRLDFTVRGVEGYRLSSSEIQLEDGGRNKGETSIPF